MPLLADTIVECGRRTLTNAINLANAWGREVGGKWQGCEVLYGELWELNSALVEVGVPY